MSRLAWGALATAVVAIIGCEAVKGLPDGGSGGNEDAGVPTDAATPDAPPALGRVEVRSLDQNNAPTPGVRVIFHDPAGEIIANTTTNTAGMAGFDDFPTGGLVTVAFTGEEDDRTFHFLLTVADVRAGDTITFGPRVPAPSFDAMGDVRFTATDVLTNGTRYQGLVGCHVVESEDASVTFAFSLVDDECTRGRNPADFLFLARDESNFPIAFQSQLGVPVTTGGADEIHLLDNWRTDFDDLSVEYAQSPSSAEEVRTDVRVARGEVLYDMDFGFNGPTTPGQQVRLPLPRGFAESVQVQSLADFGVDLGTFRGSLVLENLSATRTTYELNLAEAALPPVNALVRVPVTAARDRVSWQTNQAAIANASGGLVLLQWTHDVSKTTWAWSALVPPDGESPFTFPVVPSDIIEDGAGDPAWPPPVAARVDEIRVVFADAPHVGDWNAMRQSRGIGFFLDSANWLPARQIDQPVVRVTQSTRFP